MEFIKMQIYLFFATYHLLKYFIQIRKFGFLYNTDEILNIYQMRLLFSYGGADSREIQHLTGEDSEAHIKENFQDFQKRFQLVQNDCQLGPNL